MNTIFLSSPYSSPDPAIVAERVRLTGDCAAWLHRAGYLPMSPIVHWHDLATRHGLPGNAEAWINWNRAWVRASDALVCLHLDGWENSVGMAMECEWARDISLPIHVIEIEAGGKFQWGPKL